MRHGHGPSIESLESRALFSVAVGAAALPLPAAAGPAPHAAAKQPTSLAGTVAGTYTVPFSPPDTGKEYDFAGAGTAGALGKVTLKGEVHLPGFVARGRPAGKLTLTNAHGSVTLLVGAPPQPGGAPLPTSLWYIITGGTGAYAKASGIGKVNIALAGQPDHGTFTFVFRPNA